MERLTTNEPKNNTEMMLNMVFAKNNEVYLRRLGANGEDISLADYCKEQCCSLCDYKIEELPSELEDFGEMMMDCECSVSTLYWACVGFAEVRNRLMKYEDEADKIRMCCTKPCHMGKDIKLIEREYKEGYEPYRQILAEYECQLRDCPKICTRYKALK